MKQHSSEIRQDANSYREWILVPLRLIIGFGFVAHGYAKLSRGPDSFGAILQTIGIPQPYFVAWVTALTEFIGGICLMAGAFVAPLTLPLAVIMITAMLKVHLQYGFSSVRLKGITVAGAEFGPIGYEMNLLYITGLLTLALSGPTKLSLGRWLSTRKQAQQKTMSVALPAMPKFGAAHLTSPLRNEVLSNTRFVHADKRSHW